jgi:hypothetical protein
LSCEFDRIEAPAVVFTGAAARIEGDEAIMEIDDIPNQPGIQPRDLVHEGTEQAKQVTQQASNIEDRMAPAAEPGRQDSKKPNKVKKEGIVSVNGEDVGRTEVEIENDRAA